jgi:hypothetical protein
LRGLSYLVELHGDDHSRPAARLSRSACGKSSARSGQLGQGIHKDINFYGAPQRRCRRDSRPGLSLQCC